MILRKRMDVNLSVIVPFIRWNLDSTFKIVRNLAFEDKIIKKSKTENDGSNDGTTEIL